jgi:hypothetical protein
MPHSPADLGLFDPREEHRPDTLNRFEHWGATTVQFVLLLFGLANAGVPFARRSQDGRPSELRRGTHCAACLSLHSCACESQEHRGWRTCDSAVKTPGTEPRVSGTKQVQQPCVDATDIVPGALGRSDRGSYLTVARQVTSSRAGE